MLQFLEAWLGLYADQGEDAAPSGQGLIEYALLLWFIAIVVFVALVYLRERIILAYSKIGNSIPN
jgi:Flp pilus assembly pilin Flp